MVVLARAFGHNHLNQFSIDDLTTWKNGTHWLMYDLQAPANLLNDLNHTIVMNRLDSRDLATGRLKSQLG